MIRSFFRIPGVSKQRGVLCYVNHFFGPSHNFAGKSSTQKPEVRLGYLNHVLESLRAIPGAAVRVCGIPGSTLIPPDVTFSSLQNPCHLVYASIEKMADEIESYDYFVNIEDDVLLKPEVFSRIKAFDEDNLINECLLPNRMENKDGELYCVDLKATPGWTVQSKNWQDVTLRVALSPHSGFFVLSRDKFKYAVERVDLSRRDIIVGGFMASAFANIHSPFALFRPFSPLEYATVMHLDNWEDPYGVQ